MARDQQSGGYLARPAPSGLADVVEIILDKGLVLDAYVRVALLGIELITVDTRLVVASVDTYLRFAEATNRLDLVEVTGPTLVEALEEGAGSMVENVAAKVAGDKVEGALDRVGDTLGEPAKKVVRGAGGKILDVAQDVAEWVSDGSRDPEED